MMTGPESLAQAQDQQSTLEILQNPAAIGRKEERRIETPPVSSRRQ